MKRSEAKANVLAGITEKPLCGGAGWMDDFAGRVVDRLAAKLGIEWEPEQGPWPDKISADPENKVWAWFDGNARPANRGELMEVIRRWDLVGAVEKVTVDWDTGRISPEAAICAVRNALFAEEME